MMRMSGADAFMLSYETPTNYMHTLKVAIIDPSTDADGWDYQRMREVFLNRIHLIPVFRYKCVPAPLSLNHPHWVEDEDFNIDYHLRRVACPAPGDQRALCEFISSVYAYQLDRSRPLWVCWVVEGLEDGKVALVSIVHHACFDGVGASNAMEQLYRPEPGVFPESRPWQPEPTPGYLARLWYAVRDWPRVVLANVPKVILGLYRKRRMERQLERDGQPTHPATRLMKKTPINAPLTAGRTFVCDTMPLADFMRVKKAFGVTLNDVYLSCCAGAIRRLLADKEFDADQFPIIAATPISGKRPDDMAAIGNFATMDFTWLRTDVADPLERLRASSEAATQMKQHHKASVEAGADFNALLRIMPHWLVVALRSWIRRQGGRVSLFGNIALSNVPGPRNDLYIGDMRLDNWFSCGQICDGTGINMTFWSYGDRANLCILADSAVLPDGWVLYDYFQQELQTLIQLADSAADAMREAS